MALKIRQKKQPTQPSVDQHESYTGRHGRNWKDQYREENQKNVRGSFVMIVVIMVIIVAILILSTVTIFNSQTDDISQITAADTFAITSYEQEQMKEAAQDFATGILFFAYCSDEDTAMLGKQLALSKIAENSDAYSKIEQLEEVERLIPTESFAPVVTDPVLRNPTMAYAGTFTWEFDAVAADTDVTSEENPDGTFADGGYHFIVSFDQVVNPDDGSASWGITDVNISAK